MGDEFSVRRYRPADTDRIRELHEKAMRDAGAFVENGPDEDLEAISETYLESGGEFLVGDLGDRTVAMGAFRPVEPTDYVTDLVSDLPALTVELTRIRVDPEYQQRGYGQRICTALERRARERGFSRVVLDTMARQTAARRLYEKLGYERTHRERIEALDDPFDLLVYQKSLTGVE